MYPRNSATPPRIAIGPVIQISDGAVQTSGVSVAVRPEGGSETAAAGTISYGGSSGVVYYAPSQSETNYEAFVLTAYKSGCIPASVTVVTSKSATTGYAGLDWSQVTGASTTVNLSGTTVKTATDVEADTQDIQSRLPAALVSGRIDASVGAMATDVITATALASSAVTEIQSGLSTLDAAAVRTAIGLASANIDTQLTAILDEANFCLTVLAGTISDAQTAAETYAITRNGSTYTIDFTGLDSTGNRGGQTLTKS
jgi:hypothetical protein